MKKMLQYCSVFLCLWCGGITVPLSYSFASDAEIRTHKIRYGETLAIIASRYYGDGKLYLYLAKVNNVRDPHRIYSGQKILIPPPPKDILSEIKSLPLESVLPSKQSTSTEVVPLPAEETVALSSAAATPPLAWKKETNNAFTTGENLEFNIRWQFINVGSASMGIEGIEEINGRKSYHIVTKANSAPFFDNFFKVRDVNESWMDTESLCSLKFASHISEGSYKRDETVLMNHENKTFTILESGKSGEILPGGPI